MFWMMFLVRGPSERSCEVISGHEGSHSFFFYNNSLQIEAREARLAPLCLSRRDALTDMQHGIPGSSFDSGLRSNFQLDLARSSCTCFEPA